MPANYCLVLFVVKKDVVGNGLKECPQCHSNLRVFSIVDELADPAEDTQIRRAEAIPTPPPTPSPQLVPGSWALKFAFGLILIIFGFVTIAFYFYHFQMNSYLALINQKNESIVQSLKSDLEDIKDHLAKQVERDRLNLTARTASRNDPRQTPNENISYTVKEGDTLWGLAEQYWEKGHYYPVLLSQNPWLSLSSDNRGVHIKILSNIERVQKEYAKTVIQISGITFLKYHVRPGDNWKKMAKNSIGKERRILSS